MTTRTTRGYALLAVLGVLLLAAVVHADDSVVNTSNGPVRGIVASTYRVFKVRALFVGIKFV
jgi:hypothetical protein